MSDFHQIESVHNNFEKYLTYIDNQTAKINKGNYIRRSAKLKVER